MRSLIALEQPQGPKLPAGDQLKVGAFGRLLAHCHTQEAAKGLLETNDCDLVLINYPCFDLLSFIKASKPQMTCILYTNLTMKQYSTLLQGKEAELLDHIICFSNMTNPRYFELNSTLQKLIRNDVFGVQKYLGAAPIASTFKIKGTNDRDGIIKELKDFCELHKLGGSLPRRVSSIAEELMMNAIYDAPVAGGRMRYAEMRDRAYELEPEEYGQLEIAYDSKILAVSVTDPFGAFARDKFFSYVKKVLQRGEIKDLIDTKKGGAGLGIFKILYDSTSLILNVCPGVKTEVIALLDCTEKIQDFDRLGRSIHYFKSELSPNSEGPQDQAKFAVLPSHSFQKS